MRHLQRVLPASLLTLAWLLASLAVAVAQGPTPADQSFWDSIKASTSASEFRAYLEAFPKGFYADRARQRISELEGRATPSPAPGPAPGPTIVSPRPTTPSTDIPFTPDPGPSRPPSPPSAPPSSNSNASVLTNYQVIREVQERLYGLNYNIKVINGQLSKETRDAIRAWQQVVQRPITGDMNQEQLDYLRGANTITVWGAIAFEARGAYGMVWNRTSRQDAENDALAECRKHAAANASACDPFTLIEKQCGALSYYAGTAGGRNHWGSFVVRRPTIEDAQRDAVEECRRQAKVPRTCQLRVSFCADGSHKR